MTDLPVLTGSPRQIEWATTIRAQTAARRRALAQHLLLRRRAVNPVGKGWTLDEAAHAYQYAGDVLFAAACERHPDAAWWIDCRDDVLDRAYGEMRGPARIEFAQAVIGAVNSRRVGA